MYKHQTIKVKKPSSLMKFLVGIKKFLCIIGLGPHDMMHDIKNKLPIVTNSTTQNDANDLNQSFLSPLVNLPNKVLLRLETPQT